MSQAIELVIVNGFVPLDELKYVLTIDKGVYSAVKEYTNMLIQQHITNSSKDQLYVQDIRLKTAKKCERCHYTKTKITNPFNNYTPTCLCCLKNLLMKRSAITRKYKLTIRDLLSIPCYAYKAGSKFAYLYTEDMAKDLRILKLIKRDNDKAANPGRLTKKEERAKRVKQLITSNNLTDFFNKYKILEKNEMICKYISGGRYGIRRITTNINQWSNFFNLITSNDKMMMIMSVEDIMPYYDTFVASEDALARMIDDEYKMIQSIKDRETQLLKNIDISIFRLSSDYRYSDFYNYMMSIETDLTITINDILEYEFFVLNTNFISIREQKLRGLFLEYILGKTNNVDNALKTINTICKQLALKRIRSWRVPHSMRLKYLN